MSDKVPSTPPPQQRFPLETPSTPLINNAGLFPTPQTSRAHHKRILSAEINNDNNDTDRLLRTPEATPRKRMCDPKATERIHHVMFPTCQSTVGSGRRYSNNNYNGLNFHINNDNKKGLLELRSSFKIQIEEDDDDDDEEDENDEEEDHGNGQRRNVVVVNDDVDDERERELMNYSSGSEDEGSSILGISKKLNLNITNTGPIINIDNDSNIPIPQTPPNQLMDDEYIKKMNVETCHDSDDLEDVQNDLNNKLTPQLNPFLNHIAHQQGTTPSNKYDPRFSGEIEMVYHSTGDKFWIPQHELGLDIRPRKLFSKLKSELISPLQDKSSFDMSSLLQTPRLQQDQLLMKELNSTEEDEIDEIESGGDVDLGLGITRAKNINPFRGSFLESQAKQQQQRKRKLGVLKRVEYVNQSTGDRQELELSDEDVIKPRKLDFTGL